MMTRIHTLIDAGEWSQAVAYWRNALRLAESELAEADGSASVRFSFAALESFYRAVFSRSARDGAATLWSAQHPLEALELVARWRGIAAAAKAQNEQQLREVYEGAKPAPLPRAGETFEAWAVRLARGAALTENEPVVATPDPTKIIGPDKNPTPPALTDWQKRFEPLRKRLLAVQDMPAETEAQRKAIKAELDSIMAALEKIGVERTGAATITKEALDAEYTRLDTRLAADIARHGELSRQLNAMEGDDDESVN
jgi:hypothetical protein